MATPVQRFIVAMEQLERTGELDPIAGLFAEDCEIENPLSTARGPDGARRFFQQYRASFARVCTTYRAIIAGEGQAALEWTSSGRAHGGEPFRYHGVTVLDFAGPRVSRLVAYFDPAELLAVAPHVHGEGAPTLVRHPELH